MGDNAFFCATSFIYLNNLNIFANKSFDNMTVQYFINSFSNQHYYHTGTPGGAGAWA